MLSFDFHNCHLLESVSLLCDESTDLVYFSLFDILFSSHIVITSNCLLIELIKMKCTTFWSFHGDPSVKAGSWHISFIKYLVSFFFIYPNFSFWKCWRHQVMNLLRFAKSINLDCIKTLLLRNCCFINNSVYAKTFLGSHTRYFNTLC